MLGHVIKCNFNAILFFLTARRTCELFAKQPIYISIEPFDFFQKCLIHYFLFYFSVKCFLTTFQIIQITYFQHIFIYVGKFQQKCLILSPEIYLFAFLLYLQIE